MILGTTQLIAGIKMEEETINDIIAAMEAEISSKYGHLLLKDTLCIYSELDKNWRTTINLKEQPSYYKPSDIVMDYIRDKFRNEGCTMIPEDLIYTQFEHAIVKVSRTLIDLALNRI